jgi:hypothetical protein
MLFDDNWSATVSVTAAAVEHLLLFWSVPRRDRRRRACCIGRPEELVRFAVKIGCWVGAVVLTCGAARYGAMLAQTAKNAAPDPAHVDYFGWQKSTNGRGNPAKCFGETQTAT